MIQLNEAQIQILQKAIDHIDRILAKWPSQTPPPSSQTTNGSPADASSPQDKVGFELMEVDMSAVAESETPIDESPKLLSRVDSENTPVSNHHTHQPNTCIETGTDGDDMLDLTKFRVFENELLEVDSRPVLKVKGATSMLSISYTKEPSELLRGSVELKYGLLPHILTEPVIAGVENFSDTGWNPTTAYSSRPFDYESSPYTLSRSRRTSTFVGDARFDTGWNLACYKCNTSQEAIQTFTSAQSTGTENNCFSTPPMLKASVTDSAALNVASRDHHSTLVVKSVPIHPHGVKDSLLQEFVIHLVTYDLPGFGESGAHPTKNLNLSALNLLFLTKVVGVVNKFWVMSYSSGSKHGPAALNYIPERSASAAFFSPFVHPYDSNMTRDEKSQSGGQWVSRRRLIKDQKLINKSIFGQFWHRDTEESIKQGNTKPFIEEDVLKLCVSSAKFGKNAHSLFMHCGFDFNSSLQSNLIDFYTKTDDVASGKRVSHGLKDKDPVCYDYLISVNSKSSQVLAARKLFDEMVEKLEMSLIVKQLILDSNLRFDETTTYTGSGTMMVFVPLLIMVAYQEEVMIPSAPGRGPFRLVICPSRELTKQTFDVAEQFLESMRKHERILKECQVPSPLLKIFKNDGTTSKRITDLVEHPLSLNLHPYTAGHLYAVIVHSGYSSDAGRYICYVRSLPSTRHKFDDSIVTEVSGRYVLYREVYILFIGRYLEECIYVVKLMRVMNFNMGGHPGKTEDPNQVNLEDPITLIDAPRQSDLMVELKRKLKPKVVVAWTAHYEPVTSVSFEHLLAATGKVGTHLLLDISDQFELSNPPGLDGVFKYLSGTCLPSNALIICGLLKNRVYSNGEVATFVSFVVKLIWSFKTTTKIILEGRPMMEFESGYNVETVFDKRKLGVEPYAVEMLSSGVLLIPDFATSNIYSISSSMSLYSRPKLIVMPCVEENISKTDLRAYEAATFTFRMILEDPSIDTLSQLIDAVLMIILKMFVKCGAVSPWNVDLLDHNGLARFDKFFEGLLVNGWLTKLVFISIHVESDLARWVFNSMYYTVKEVRSATCSFWCDVLLVENEIIVDLTPSYPEFRKALEVYGYVWNSSTNTSCDSELVQDDLEDTGPPQNFQILDDGVWDKSANFWLLILEDKDVVERGSNVTGFQEMLLFCVMLGQNYRVVYCSIFAFACILKYCHMDAFFVLGTNSCYRVRFSGQVDNWVKSL